METPKFKINRSFILMQMIVMPIIVTALMMTPIPNLFYSSKYSEDINNFIYLLSVLIPIFVIGIILGFVFSKKQKKADAKDKIISVIIPILYALIFAVPIWIIAKNNLQSTLWGIYFLKNPAFFIADIAIIFGGLLPLVIASEIVAYASFALGVLLSNFTIKKVINIVALAVIIISFTFTYFVSSDTIFRGYTDLKYGAVNSTELSEFALDIISPFKMGNGLVVLDKESPLIFDNIEDMPKLDGATAAYPVYAAFAQAVYKGLQSYSYEAKVNFVNSNEYPYNIISCTKTNTAYQRLINGKCDIFFGAEPSKAQIQAVKAKGDEFVLTQIASEAFVFFANKENKVTNLLLEQIQKIYTGEITNWNQVGGINKKIVPYQRPQDSGSQTIMQNKVMKNLDMLKPTIETYSGGMGDIIKRVSQYKNAPNSIGYTFLHYSSVMMKSNQIKYIGVNGVIPSAQTIRDKSYILTIPVYAVTLKSNKSENVAKMIEFCKSDYAQEIVNKTGYVGIR